MPDDDVALTEAVVFAWEELELAEPDEIADDVALALDDDALVVTAGRVRLVRSKVRLVTSTKSGPGPVLASRLQKRQKDLAETNRKGSLG